MDVDTLYEIAEALSVSISQLMPEIADKPLISPKDTGSHIFMNYSKIYAYYYVAETLFLSVFIPTFIEGNVVHCNVYMESENTEDYSKCKFFLNADVFCIDSGMSITLRNPMNYSDHGFIYAKMPYSQTSLILGLFTFSSERLNTPTTVKIAFSRTPLTNKDKLIEELSINSKHTIDIIKKSNVFAP